LLVTHPVAAVLRQTDDQAGGLPVAFVVASPGVPPDETTLNAFVAAHEATYKQIHRVIQIEAIPKSASGRILCRLLRPLSPDPDRGTFPSIARSSFNAATEGEIQAWKGNHASRRRSGRRDLRFWRHRFCVGGDRPDSVLSLHRSLLDRDDHPRGARPSAGLTGTPETNAHTLTRKEIAMNWDQIQGNWKQMKGNVREKWGDLTDDDMDRAAGNREQLEGVIQERYGRTKDQARKEVDDWMSTR